MKAAGNSSTVSAYQSANQQGQQWLHSAFSSFTLHTSNSYDLCLSSTLNLFQLSVTALAVYSGEQCILLAITKKCHYVSLR